MYALQSNILQVAGTKPEWEYSEITLAVTLAHSITACLGRLSFRAECAYLLMILLMTGRGIKQLIDASISFFIALWFYY
jgi:hypothetical protein